MYCKFSSHNDKKQWEKVNKKLASNVDDTGSERKPKKQKDFINFFKNCLWIDPWKGKPLIKNMVCKRTTT